MWKFVFSLVIAAGALREVSTTGKCTRQNEIYDPCPDCSPQTCASRGQIFNCPLIPASKTGPSCKPACRCKQGYLRDDLNQCIPENQCCKCTRQNEIYDPCPDCSPQTCASKGKIYHCPLIPVNKTGPSCKPACRCKQGYLRNDSNQCIPENQCRKCTRQNEIYDPCPDCSPQTCASKGKIFHCPLIPANKTGPSCKPACRCKQGYLRNDSNQCIPENQCRKCTRQNEIYDPCPDCSPQTCASRGQIFNCPLIPASKTGPSCKPACRCKQGYLRNDCNQCIPENQCPSECKENEQYNSCVNGGCLRKTCRDLDRPIRCVRPAKCKPGCLCIDNYLRAENGTCIPVNQCPNGCGGDENAQSGCGTNCGKKCSDVGKNGPFACPEICQLNGCDCKDGFYLDSNKNKCVPADECSLPCGDNETYSLCAEGPCIKNSCEDRDKPVCVRGPLPSECTPGCRCISNYLRKNGVCVPEDQCDSTSSACGNTDGQLISLKVGISAFAGKCLYNRVMANPENSVVSSPFSITVLMALLALYARAETHTQIMEMINLKANDEIRCALPALLDTIVASNGTELDLANKIYISSSYNITGNFKKDAKELIRAEPETINFLRSNQAANKINQWVSQATRNKIQNLVSPNMFTDMTRLVLANAIYFKGIWKTKFNKNQTKKADFYKSNGVTSQMDMMFLRDNLPYYEIPDLDSKVVELTYQDDNITFVIILPNKNDGLLDLATKLKEGNTLSRAISTFSMEKVKLYLPKFEISNTIDMKGVLESVGVNKVFSRRADVFGVIEPDEPLGISYLIQKAYINVDEEGSVASAASAATIDFKPRPGPPPPLEYTFRADHPFVYMIKIRKSVLFIGTVA